MYVNVTISISDENYRIIQKNEHKAKCPPKGSLCVQAVAEDQGKEFYTVIFDCIDKEVIHRAALNTNIAAGPSAF